MHVLDVGLRVGEQMLGGRVVTDRTLDLLFEPDSYLHFHDAVISSARLDLEVEFLRAKLGLNREMSVLDLGCGQGRHSNRLAETAKEIVALDRSPGLLEFARSRAAELGLDNVTYVEADMRDLSFASRFDRALLVNTILGLFDDGDNQAVLNRLFLALKPGGIACLDVVNRDTIMVGLQRHSVTEVDGDYLIDRLDFNAKTGRMTNDRVYIRGGQATSASFSLRLYNLTELSTMLLEAGFIVRRTFGDWIGSPFEAASKKIIILAEKPS